MREVSTDLAARAVGEARHDITRIGS